MNNLERHNYKKDGSNKYHINCNELEKNPELIPINLENIIKHQNDIIILQSVLNDKNITSKYRNIVIKIGHTNKTIEKEYNIGKKLEEYHIIGFINYICLFNCYDNTTQSAYNNIKNNIIKKICSADKTNENNKVVLIMPYINEGSIKNFNWTEDKFDILKSLLLQAVLSSYIAYDKCGFIHNDFHLDNILCKKTKKDIITYNNINIKSFGYKIIIMDFENSFIDIDTKTGIEFYWINLYNMLSRVNSDLINKKYDMVSMNNLKDIISFIEKQKLNKNNHKNTLKLIDMIMDSTFSIIKSPMANLTYNPYI
jgi:hypothetical protein